MSELVLEGAFRALSRAGLPLGARDYTAALMALEAGFGVGSRSALLWLCQSLWARTDDEVRLIKATFDRMPAATPEEVVRASARADRTSGAEVPAPLPASPAARPAAGARSTDPETPVRLQFTGGGATGLPLPRALIADPPGEAFRLAGRPMMEERAMAIAWRRFHRPARAGVGSELDIDIDASVQAQARDRVLAEPVLLPARLNRARVVLALDVSPSMAAWLPFALSLESSLRHGRLAAAAVRHFENVPDELWQERALTSPVDLPRELAATDGSALLVFSDGGAARGHRSRERAARTTAFFGMVGQRWRPIVWLNPMPRSRWRGTTAELIAGHPGVLAFERGPEELTRAIDALRGRG